MVKDNYPSFKRTGVAEIMCVLDRESDADAMTKSLPESGGADQGAPSLSPVDADVLEATTVPSPGLILPSEEARELVTSSKAPPSGWRRRRFWIARSRTTLSLRAPLVIASAAS